MTNIVVLHLPDGSTKAIVEGIDPFEVKGLSIHLDDKFNIVDTDELLIGDPAELVSIQQDLAALGL